MGQKRGNPGNFPEGPVVRMLHFHCRGQGWILGWELRFLQPLSLGQLKERKQVRRDDGLWKCLQFGSAICPLCYQAGEVRDESGLGISFRASYHLLPASDVILLAGFAESSWTLLCAQVTSWS